MNKDIEQAAIKVSKQIEQPYKSAPVGMSDYQYWLNTIMDVIESDAAKEYWFEQFKKLNSTQNSGWVKALTEIRSEEDDLLDVIKNVLEECNGHAGGAASIAKELKQKFIIQSRS